MASTCMSKREELWAVESGSGSGSGGAKDVEMREESTLVKQR